MLRVIVTHVIGGQQDGLKKIRKKLLIRTGPTQNDIVETTSAAPTGKGGVAASASGGGGAGKGGTPDVKGKMFRKFFQTSDDDDDGGTGMSHQESQLDDRGVEPGEMWDTVRQEA